jgi:AcrR family transcriptional regulator
MISKDRQTEDRIFEAATEVFLEKGMDGARMQDIADRAGINKSLLNYYYRSKDRLFGAVFEMIGAKMLEKFSPVFDKNLSTEEKIRFFFKEHISFLQHNPRLPLFLLNEINRDPERLRKFINNLDLEKLFSEFRDQTLNQEGSNDLPRETLVQLITSIIAMSVFPFAAKGILEAVLGKLGISFDEYLETRKEFAAGFVIGALENMKNK